MSKRIIGFDRYEYGILINALNDFRTNLIKQKCSTDSVDNLLVKIIETPEKKKFSLKINNKARFKKIDEAR